MALRGQSRPRRKPHIARVVSQSGRMDRSIFRTMSRGGFTRLFTRAGPLVAGRSLLPARVALRRPALSSKPRLNHPRALTPLLAVLFPLARQRRWRHWVIAPTPARWGEPRAQAAMVRMAKEVRWGPI